jgi:hypothetical protein
LDLLLRALLNLLHTLRALLDSARSLLGSVLPCLLD